MQLVREAGIIELMGSAGAPGRVLLPDQGAALARNRRGRRPVIRRVDRVLARMTLAVQHYGHERLDQVTVEHILGVR